MVPLLRYLVSHVRAIIDYSVLRILFLSNTTDLLTLSVALSKLTINHSITLYNRGKASCPIDHPGQIGLSNLALQSCVHQNNRTQSSRRRS